MQVAVRGGAAELVAPRRRRRVALAGGQRLEDRVEAFDRFGRAADHEAVAAVLAPDAAGSADVEIVDSLGSQLLGPANVVDVVGIAAVDERVALLQERRVVGNHAVGDARGDHQPHVPRRRQLGDQLLRRVGAHRLPFALLDDLGHDLGVPVEGDARVSAARQPLHHVGTHAAQTDHS